MDFVETVKSLANKLWNYMKKARIELIVLAGVFVLDLFVKIIVHATMSLNQTIEVIPNFFHLTYVHNYAAAFGSFFGLENVLGKDAVRVLLLIFTFVAIVVFCYFFYRFRGKNMLARISIALIIGGAVGNYIDRLFLGYVRDFVEIIYFGLDIPLLGESFAIFNIADMALTGGVISFLVYFIFYFKDPKKDLAPTKKQLLKQQSEEAAKIQANKTQSIIEKKELADRDIPNKTDMEPSKEQSEESGVRSNQNDESNLQSATDMTVQDDRSQDKQSEGSEEK